jgi:hypothetical protein
MAETERTTITLADIDANNNVVVWDHGPRRDDPGYPEWRSSNDDSDLPRSILMHSITAAHALAVDPARYALDPRGVSEAELNAEIAVLVQGRKDAAKRAADIVAARQRSADYLVASQTVAARRKAAAMAKPKTALPDAAKP